ncbi:hypothetical protein [Microbulbifer sp. TYP-18]|uniref:hypothetical protein n=1 Tax=Microbulbifer sp. TYP-18 TaxID=3230024 RepID=UPI0034C6DA26
MSRKPGLREAREGFLNNLLGRQTYESVVEPQANLDEWLTYYNNYRTDQDMELTGHTLMETP